MAARAQAAHSRRLFLDEGNEIVLGPYLGGGGEAKIYELQRDSSRVVKLYHKPSEDRRRALEAMLKAVPNDPQRARRNHISICWPEELVLDEAGHMAGFIMPRLDISTHRPVAIYWNPEDRALFSPGFTWKYLCVAAANIASLVDLIHAKGHVIGDLNDENILVNERALATIVDCDSMQIRDPEDGTIFRSELTREPYISPEAIGKTLAAYDRSQTDDYWALAVLIFQILMEGQHPTNGIGDPEERRERIRRGIFPFFGEAGFSLPKYALPLSILPPNLTSLFQRCFRDGHGDPSARPTALQWRNELTSLAGSLSQCAEVESHWYSPHQSCPWCEEERCLGFDRFGPIDLASTPGAQTALPPSSPPPPAAAQTSAAVNGQNVQTTPPVTGAGGRTGIILLTLAGFIVFVILIALANNSNSSTSSGSDGGSSSASSSNPASGGTSGSFATSSSSPPSNPPSNPPGNPAGSPSTTSSGSATPPPAAGGAESNAAAGQSGPSFKYFAEMFKTFTPAPPSSLMLTANGDGFSVKYPLATWSIFPRQTKSEMLLCQTDAVRKRSETSQWMDFCVTVGFILSAELNLSTSDIATTFKRVYPTATQVSQTSQQTGWGPGIWTEFRTPTEFLFTEASMILTVQRPTGVGFVILESPEKQWNEAKPTLDSIYQTISFQ